jgi:competence protein ComEA
MIETLHTDGWRAKRPGLRNILSAKERFVKRLATKVTKISAWAVCVCAYSMMLALSYAQQAPAQKEPYPELPAGAGKDTLVRVCSKCHSPDNVIANGQDRAGWEETITKMAGFGAVGTDDEFTAILDYLVKNFPADSGVVNVNKATAAQLASGLGLSDAEAGAVVDYRKKNGDFKTIDDLKKVPDVDGKKLDAKKDRLAF